MTKENELKLKVSLNNALNIWVKKLPDELIGDIGICWGDNTISLMAEASANIIIAISDVRDYMETNDMIK